MNKATLSGILLSGLLFATPLVQAQTPVPPEPMNEESAPPPSETSPSDLDDDPQRPGEAREPEGAFPDLNQDGVPDDEQPDTEPLPGDDREGDSDRDSEY